jgi:hypothetical protein
MSSNYLRLLPIHQLCVAIEKKPPEIVGILRTNRTTLLKFLGGRRCAVVIQQVEVIELLVEETVEIFFRVHRANLVFHK